MFLSPAETHPFSKDFETFCGHVELQSGRPVLGVYVPVVGSMGKRKDMIHPRFLGEYIRLLAF